jgi:hypothetical protein
MKDHNIIERLSMPMSHPVPVAVTINLVDWFNFQRLNDNRPETNVIGHDEPRDGRITIYVACVSEEIKKLLEDGWRSR